MKKEAIALFMAFSIGSNMTGQEEARLGFYQGEELPPAIQTVPKDTYSKRDIQAAIIREAEAHDLPVHFVLAIAEHESGFNWLARKVDKVENSRGVFQINFKYHNDRCGVENDWEFMDPSTNIKCGVSYIRLLFDRVESVLGSYESWTDTEERENYFLGLVACGYNGGEAKIQNNGRCGNDNAANYAQAVIQGLRG